MMKLKANVVPYSSVVGGGLSLLDENGRARYQIMFIGTTDGISKEVTGALSKQIGDYINKYGLEIP